MFDSIWGPNLNDILTEYINLREIVDTYDENTDLTTSVFTSENIKRYTYDIMFIHATCESLIDNNGQLNLYDMINRFLICYKTNATERGFASGIVNIFNKMKKLEIIQQLEEKFYYPSFELFNGEGSCGNGAGMRCSPIALYTINKSLYEMEVC